jgi:hypothetical protein
VQNQTNEKPADRREEETLTSLGAFDRKDSHRELKSISLQTVPAYVCHGQKRVLVNVFLDGGSNTSFINEDLVDFLGIKKGPTMRKEVQTLNGKRQVINTCKVDVSIQSISKEFNQTVSLLTSSNVTGETSAFDWNTVKKNWPHLQEIDFPLLAPSTKHDLLIGTDLAYLLSSVKEVTDGMDAPVARLTPLGWTAMGSINAERSVQGDLNTFHVGISSETSNSEIQTIIKAFWEIDAIGVKDTAQKTQPKLTLEDENAFKKMNEETQYNPDRQHYVVPILWKQECHKLKSNREMAIKRDQNLTASLNRRPEVKKSYERTMQQYIDKGYIQSVSDIREDSWYCPHFPVVKGEKVRIVFDCAAKHKEQSLNSEILKGPKLQNEVTSVLLRFRLFEHALVGDIEEMYLQFRLHPDDQRYCRFVWNGTDWEWKRLIFGRTDSPFIAIRTLQQHARHNSAEYPHAAEAVLRAMYVDDLLISCADEREVNELHEELNALLEKAGLKMKKWLSSSRKVMTTIPKHLHAKEISFEPDAPLPTQKTLGLQWNAEKDELSFAVDSVRDNSSDSSFTKRKMLSVIAKIFDPLGLMSPFFLYAKILLQQIWASGADWDDPLSEELTNQCLKWCEDWANLPTFAIPRFIGVVPGARRSLHVFCDASKEAYSAVAYCRTEGVETTVRIVFAKTRVSPMKAYSIPRLELMGAVIAVRLAETVCHALEFSLKHEVTFWTDSVDVL